MRTAVRNYALVTGAYWGFTLTDGALRMLVLLHFDRLGYSAVAIAFLFLFYEFFGIVTNLLGGWIAARSGLEGYSLWRLAASDRRADHAGPAAARMVARRVGRIRDGGASALGNRERSDQDERQERDQSGGARKARMALSSDGSRG